VWIGAFLIALTAAARGLGGEPRCCEPPQVGFLERVCPAGGWDPYGGGLLHWWPSHCFPRCGGADDYCRKKLPPVCWPSYPAWYIWGPPPAAVTVPNQKDRVSPP
jgi:hypothetical protein